MNWAARGGGGGQGRIEFRRSGRGSRRREQENFASLRLRVRFADWWLDLVETLGSTKMQAQLVTAVVRLRATVTTSTSRRSCKAVERQKTAAFGFCHRVIDGWTLGTSFKEQLCKTLLPERTCTSELPPKDSATSFLNAQGFLNNKIESLTVYPNGCVQAVAGASSGASSSTSGADDFKCPEQFGYYADTTDCSKYFVCVFGDPLHESCTGGLYFSVELQTCDWPRNVQCSSAGSVSSITNNSNPNGEPKKETSSIDKKAESAASSLTSTPKKTSTRPTSTYITNHTQMGVISASEEIFNDRSPF
ncbi:hypothetical protein BIW11_04248 [Tropilaelaps mercedesae]|uniref:Chitin-binding type-2 domain-containing protein n=1 Tax=Tropilaelaps mercedesae TaxID=418985 RepID=A0A1V9X8Z5_9ACAR|nr:hypothetical protein BIW11_04248 [Tropilaelaps mercedesae]